jgi:hypothetical protein
MQSVASSWATRGPRPATLPRKVLRPLALLDRLRFTLDRDPALGNLAGELVIEKR